MTTKPLCLGCYDDFVEEWADPPYCYKCYLKHQAAERRAGIRYAADNDERSDWWGPTLDTINPEDIENGYYIAPL